MPTPIVWKSGINFDDTNFNNRPHITALADGRFVVAWCDNTNDVVRAQILNADGSARGNSFVLSRKATSGAKEVPAICALKDGSFVAVWTEQTDPASNNPQGGKADVVGRIFKDGVPVDDEIHISWGSNPTNYLFRPAITATDDGFVVSRSQYDSHPNSTENSVWVSSYNSSGAFLDAHDFTTTNYEFPKPAITTLEGGDQVVVWVNANSNGATTIRAAIGSRDTFVQVDIATGPDFFDPQVTKLVGGGFVVTWEAENQSNGIDDAKVMAQVFSATGQPVSNPIDVSSGNYHLGENPDPVVTAPADGRFAVAWADRAEQGGLRDIKVQVFSATGQKDGNPLWVSPPDATNDQMPTISTLEDGRIVISWWHDATPEIMTQIIDPREAGINLVDSGSTNDDHIGTNFGDTMDGGAGNDQIRAQGGNDSVYGGDGNDTLYGGAGVDTIRGGAGNDVYHTTVGDKVIEEANQGTDKVVASSDWTLSDHVENLDLSTAARGVGNDLANIINGSGGNDVLVGGGGADTLRGGAGDDVYYIDGSDVIVDTSGFDTVHTAATVINLDDYARMGIEQVFSTATGPITVIGGQQARTLNGTDNNDVLTASNAGDVLNGGRGNDAMNGGAGNDIFYGGIGNDAMSGGAGNDVFDGGVGADRMAGGTGNDIYYVDDAWDLVIEAARGGIDSVFTSVSFALGGNEVENLIATGTANISLTGSAHANTLKGNAGKNTLKGGSGNDKLYGGYGNDVLWGQTGKDAFVFDSRYGTTSSDRKVNFDTIKDFKVRDDSIYLDNGIFKKLGSGTEAKPKLLKSAYFKIGKATDKNDYVLYDKRTGVLSYDADGSGRGKAVEIAQLSKKLAMTYKDFYVI